MSLRCRLPAFMPTSRLSNLTSHSPRHQHKLAPKVPISFMPPDPRSNACAHVCPHAPTFLHHEHPLTLNARPYHPTACPSEDAPSEASAAAAAAAKAAAAAERERQLSKKELKKKELEELDAVFAEFGINVEGGKDEAGGGGSGGKKKKKKGKQGAADQQQPAANGHAEGEAAAAASSSDAGKAAAAKAAQRSGSEGEGAEGEQPVEVLDPAVVRGAWRCWAWLWIWRRLRMHVSLWVKAVGVGCGCCCSTDCTWLISILMCCMCVACPVEQSRCQPTLSPSSNALLGPTNPLHPALFPMIASPPGQGSPGSQEEGRGSSCSKEEERGGRSPCCRRGPGTCEEDRFQEGHEPLQPGADALILSNLVYRAPTLSASVCQLGCSFVQQHQGAAACAVQDRQS